MSEQQYRTIPPEEWDQNTVQVGDRFGKGEIERVEGTYCLDKRDGRPPHWWITAIFLGVAKSQGLTWQRPVGEPALTEPKADVHSAGPEDFRGTDEGSHYDPKPLPKPAEPSKPNCPKCGAKPMKALSGELWECGSWRKDGENVCSESHTKRCFANAKLLYPFVRVRVTRGRDAGKSFVVDCSDFLSIISEIPSTQNEVPIAILQECVGVAGMLLKKNAAYGNSAIDPVRIFSKADSIEQIRVRIDDKLSRLASGQANDTEDIELDLIGYLILLKVAKKTRAKLVEEDV